MGGVTGCSNGDDSDSDKKDKEEPIVYSSLQAKLDAADAASTVTLTESDFSDENLELTVSKALTITASEQISAKNAIFTVKAAGVTLKNLSSITKITVAQEVGDGEFYLENCEVGSVDAYGGGENSFYIIGAIIKEIFNIFKPNLHVQQQSGSSIHTVAVNANNIHLDAKNPGNEPPKFGNVHLKNDVEGMKIGGNAKIEHLFADNYETKVTINSNDVEVDASGTKTEEGDIIQLTEIAYGDGVDASSVTLSVIDDRTIDDIASEISGVEIQTLQMAEPQNSDDGVHFTVNVPAEGVYLANIMRKDAENPVYTTAVQVKSKNASQLPVGDIELIDYFIESGKEYTYYAKLKDIYGNTLYRTDEITLTAAGGFGEMTVTQMPEAKFDDTTEMMTFSKTLKFTPELTDENPIGKMQYVYEKSVSNESAALISYVSANSEDTDVRATIYFSNVEENTATSWAMSATGDYKLYGVRTGYGYEENGLRFQSFKWNLASYDPENKLAPLPATITFTQSVTAEAKEDGIHITTSVPSGVTNIIVWRYEEDLDMFQRVMGVSKPVGNSLEMIDYFVVSNKEYRYRIIYIYSGYNSQKNLDKITATGGSGEIPISTEGVSITDENYDKTTGALIVSSFPTVSVPTVNGVDFVTSSMRTNLYLLTNDTSISTAEIPLNSKKINVPTAASSLRNHLGETLSVAKYISVSNINLKQGNNTVSYSRCVPRPTDWLDSMTLPAIMKNIYYFDYGEVEATDKGLQFTIDLEAAYAKYENISRIDLTIRPMYEKDNNVRRNIQFQKMTKDKGSELVYVEKFVEADTPCRFNVQLRNGTTDLFNTGNATLTPTAGNGAVEITAMPYKYYNKNTGSCFTAAFNTTTTPATGYESFLSNQEAGQTESVTFSVDGTVYTPLLKTACIQPAVYYDVATTTTNLFQIYTFGLNGEGASVSKDYVYTSAVDLLLRNKPAWLGKTLTYSQTAYVKMFVVKSDASAVNNTNGIDVKVYAYSPKIFAEGLSKTVTDPYAGKAYQVLGHEGATVSFGEAYSGKAKTSDSSTTYLYPVIITDTASGKTVTSLFRVQYGYIYKTANVDAVTLKGTIKDSLYVTILSNEGTDYIALGKRDNNKNWNITENYEISADGKTVKYGNNNTYENCTQIENVFLTSDTNNPFYADWGGYVCRDGFGEISFE